MDVRELLAPNEARLSVHSVKPSWNRNLCFPSAPVLKESASIDIVRSLALGRITLCCGLRLSRLLQHINDLHRMFKKVV